MALEPKAESGRFYHIELRKRDVGRVALLPGDPGRVPRIAKYFKDPKLLSSHREYTSYGGYVGEEYVVAMSTGIGGPAAAIAIEELARLGVRVMVRVGTCGGLHPAARVGTLVIADAAVRLDGVTKQYVMESYPAAATPEVVTALKEAAKALKMRAIVGITASSDSFYVGQGRPGFGGYFPSNARTLISDLRAANVISFEMEASTLFTLGRLFGVRTGAIFGVVANRVTNDFRADAGVEDAIRTSIEAVKQISRLLKKKDLS